MSRRDKHNYYLDIAQTVAERGTCLRRNYGAIIVKNDEIISTGYVGAPRGRKNCSDLGYCIRQEMNIPRGERYEMCRSVHAEANAIISASRNELLDATLYLVGMEKSTGEIIRDSCCCSMCKRMVINAGIKNVVIRDTMDEFRIIEVNSWVEDDESLIGKMGY
ncbi:MAG: cytidine deaminase [Ruminococcaceae bacterium]|nr:cytidine deaminase [Oscillospiraceae bacterium]